MEKHSLTIKGMGSQHCVMVVKNIIAKQEGALLDDIEIGKANITIDETKTSRQEVVTAIEKMGYKVEQ
jgi:copper chaperone CopZ